ncbi:hypothetical protein [Terribacillus sp. 7520-G]|uniref:hypothetical protein n=1 Tax=Terribacillus sp. 7520-G TaxID=2025389 RepID=UPI0011801BB1|nr:hypothetical protein [Terribacillus sp. 7520-G]
MEEHDRSASSSIRAYSFLIASICTFLIGNFLSIGMYGSLAFGAGFAQEGDLTVVRRSGLILGLLPFIALFFISLIIPSRQMIKANTTRSIG